VEYIRREYFRCNLCSIVVGDPRPDLSVIFFKRTVVEMKGQEQMGGQGEESIPTLVPNHPQGGFRVDMVCPKVYVGC